MIFNNFFTKPLSLLVILVSILLLSCKETKETKVEIAENDPWKIMQQILDSAVDPTIPDKTFNILDFGGVADGVTNNTLAFYSLENLENLKFENTYINGNIIKNPIN